MECDELVSSIIDHLTVTKPGANSHNNKIRDLKSSMHGERPLNISEAFFFF